MRRSCQQGRSEGCSRAYATSRRGKSPGGVASLLFAIFRPRSSRLLSCPPPLGFESRQNDAASSVHEQLPEGHLYDSVQPTRNDPIDSCYWPRPRIFLRVWKDGGKTARSASFAGESPINRPFTRAPH